MLKQAQTLSDSLGYFSPTRSFSSNEGKAGNIQSEKPTETSKHFGDWPNAQGVCPPKVHMNTTDVL